MIHVSLNYEGCKRKKNISPAKGSHYFAVNLFPLTIIAIIDYMFF